MSGLETGVDRADMAFGTVGDDLMIGGQQRAIERARRCHNETIGRIRGSEQ